MVPDWMLERATFPDQPRLATLSFVGMSALSALADPDLLQFSLAIRAFSDAWKRRIIQGVYEPIEHWRAQDSVVSAAPTAVPSIGP
jgi:hypothetical protein